MATNANSDKSIQALKERGCEPHRNGDEWRAKCPCHDGTTNNSLAISADGKMYCHSCGVNTSAILKELGLAEPAASRKQKVSVDGKEVSLHDSEESAIQGLQWAVFQKKAGVTPRPPDRIHRYDDVDGNHIGTVVLWKFSDSEKDARQIRKHGSGWICKGMTEPRPLYRLPELAEASSIVIVEGEKAADALRSIGLTASTPTQGAKSPKKTDWSVLGGKCVTISVDNDQAGHEFGKLVIDLLPDSCLSVKVVELRDDWSELPVKGDSFDWVEHFRDVEQSALRNRFKALPDHFETINAIVLEKKQRVRETNEAGSAIPRVELLMNEKFTNDLAIQSLTARGDIYDHYGSLALVVDELVDGEQTRKKIQHLNLATLREIMTESCVFFEMCRDKRTDEMVEMSRRIPRWCYEAVLARGSWAGIRPIRGIVSCPVLRADGSILQTQGYDNDSGLYVDLNEKFPDIDSAPTPEAVTQAVAKLLDLVSDFPFKDASSLSAWVAGLLTPLAREAYRGCTGPLFLIDANVAGSGKTILADIIALIDTGREVSRMAAPRSDEETRKRITALVCDDERIILIDNIPGLFGCASLDAALTGTVWKDRRLGHTELVEFPLRMTWFASGNNVVLLADTARRVCHIRLESKLENPEDREGFKYPDIRAHVRKNRPALLAASLTILRGYISAGRPDQRLKPWGSFEGWSDLVRNSIVWSGLQDPGETRTDLRAASDNESGSLRQMLTAVANVDQDQHGLRTSDMLKIANARDQSYAADDMEMMREAIEMFCGRSIAKANAQHLGNQLSHFRNRVVDQMAFDCTVKRGSNYWFVHVSGGPVVPGGPDSANLYARKIVDVETTPNANDLATPSSGENRSTTSTTSTTSHLCTTMEGSPDLDWLDESPL